MTTHIQRLRFPKEAVVSQEGRADYLLVTLSGHRLMSMDVVQGKWGFHLEYDDSDLIVVVTCWE